MKLKYHLVQSNLSGIQIDWGVLVSPSTDRYMNFVSIDAVKIMLGLSESEIEKHARKVGMFASWGGCGWMSVAQLEECIKHAATVLGDYILETVNEARVADGYDPMFLRTRKN